MKRKREHDPLGCYHVSCDALPFSSVDDLLVHGIQQHSTEHEWYCAVCNSHYTQHGEKRDNKGLPQSSHWKKHLTCRMHERALSRRASGSVPEQLARDDSMQTSRSIQTSASIQDVISMDCDPAETSLLPSVQSTVSEPWTLEQENITTSSQQIDERTEVLDTTLDIESTENPSTTTSVHSPQSSIRPSVVDARSFEGSANESYIKTCDDLKDRVKRPVTMSCQKKQVEGFSVDNPEQFFPFPNLDWTFWQLLYCLYPQSASAIDIILQFLHSPDYGFNPKNTPKRVSALEQWVPSMEDGVVKIPDIGFLLLLDIAKDKGMSAFFDLEGLVKAALGNPTVAKHLSDKKFPVKTDDRRVTTIEQSPVYASNSITTLPLSLRIESSSGKSFRIGDLVKFTSQGSPSYGFIRSLYLQEGATDVTHARVDLQMITFGKDLYPTLPWEKGEYVVTREVRKGISVNRLLQQRYSNRVSESTDECIVIRKQVFKRFEPSPPTESHQSSDEEPLEPETTDDQQESQITETTDDQQESQQAESRPAPRLSYQPSLISVLERFDYFSRFSKIEPTDFQKQHVTVLCVELNKDELTVFNTRGYLVDVANFNVKDIPPDVQEKFASVWTHAAFSPSLPMQDRFEMLARFIREGEQGFWAFNAHTKRMEYVYVSFAISTGDQKELVAASSCRNHSPSAVSQCIRCLARKANLDDPKFDLDGTEMTSERRRGVYATAQRLSSLKKIGDYLKPYGLQPIPSPFLFCESLDFPRCAIADLLHDVGINTVGYVTAFLWVVLNDTGRKKLRVVLRRKGKELNNQLISRLFVTRSGKLLEMKGTLEQNLTAAKDHLKLKGVDFEQLMKVFGEVVSFVNKEENYNEQMSAVLDKVTTRNWDKIEKMFGTMEKTKVNLIGLMTKYFVKMYWILKDHRNGRDINRERDRFVYRFFIILRRCFYGIFLKPSFHDLLHLLDQNKHIIPISMANTSKSESKNHLHRFAATIGNKRNPEYFIMRLAWISHFLQHMLDGGVFSYGKAAEDHKFTGPRVQQVLHDLFSSTETRLLFPAKELISTPGWFAAKRKPEVCDGGVTIANIIRNNNREQKSMRNLDLEIYEATKEVQLLIKMKQFSQNYIAAFSAQIPGIGTVSVGSALRTQSFYLILEEIFCCEREEGVLPPDVKESINRLIEKNAANNTKMEKLTKRISVLVEKRRIVAEQVRLATTEIHRLYKMHQVLWIPHVVLKGKKIEKMARVGTEKFTAEKLYRKTDTTVVCTYKDVRQSYDTIRKTEFSVVKCAYLEDG